jgi:hypothetical protein
MTPVELSWWWSGYLIVVVALFAVIEGHAYIYGGQMLTHWIRNATVLWPWTPHVMGAVVIALALHFWFE